MRNHGEREIGSNVLKAEHFKGKNKTGYDSVGYRCANEAIKGNFNHWVDDFGFLWRPLRAKIHARDEHGRIINMSELTKDDIGMKITFTSNMRSGVRKGGEKMFISNGDYQSQFC